MTYTREELIYLRLKCDQSLEFFTRLFFKELKGAKFKLNWHHTDICEKLQEAEGYKYRFVNINIPPRMSKTEIALNFIARGLGNNPRANYFYITASDELRKHSSNRIRDIVSSELFYLLYSVRLKKDMKARNLWRTEQGGGLKTATINGQITGFGAGQMTRQYDENGKRLFEGAMILDDIDKIKDVEKGTANAEDTHNIIFNTIFSRFNSEDTPLINIQQRAGEEDSTSVLLNYFGKTDPKKVCNIQMPVIYKGKPLWPEQMSMEKIEETRTSHYTAHVFETQYMQNPTSPNDKPFHKSKLKYFESDEISKIKAQSEAFVGYIDPKDEGQDYYCHVAGHLIGKTIYITDVIHNQLNTEHTVPKSINLINENKADVTVIETNNMGSMVFKDIRDATSHLVLGVNNQANKATRIVNCESIILNDFRFMKDPEPGSDYDTYMDKLSKYEYGKSKIDDAPDATAGLGQLLKVRYSHLYTSNDASE